MFRRGEANPQGIEGRYVLVRRKRPLFEVIVEIQAAPGIPKVFLNVFLARLGTIAPFGGIFCAAEQFADLLHILFGLIEQAVEANRSIVMSFCAVGSKSERYVVSGFAHGAITFVVVGAQRDAASPEAFLGGQGLGAVADLNGKNRAQSWTGLGDH